MLIQAFVNYNIPDGHGWYVSNSPIVTANWNSSGEKWVVPEASLSDVCSRSASFPINMQLGV
jgi:hypothetical protein